MFSSCPLALLVGFVACLVFYCSKFWGGNWSACQQIVPEALVKNSDYFIGDVSLLISSRSGSLDLKGPRNDSLVCRVHLGMERSESGLSMDCHMMSSHVALLVTSLWVALLGSVRKQHRQGIEAVYFVHFHSLSPEGLPGLTVAGKNNSE